MGDPQDQSDTKPTSSLQSSSSPMPSSNEELRNLRRLILGGDLDEVFKTSIDTDELSELLPLALEKSQKNKEALARALLPTVEAAIQTSIRQDNRILSDAFFPIIGPATRKSIAAAIGNLVQSLNQTLEHSLSPQSFKWRLEARRTGKSFAEVVLVRTLIYQVEQVFFIHRESGLVMQHLVSETAIAQDPKLASAFVTKDSLTKSCNAVSMADTNSGSC
ncbi:MAG: OmpA family protein, partial [Cyanobacteria bacterium J06554_3]